MTVTWCQVVRLLQINNVNDLFFCSSADYLKITNNTNHTYGTYCGQMTRQSIIVTGEYITLTFHSDFGLEEKGYQIYITARKYNAT